ncbi:hypothetical protein REPUB_Repub08aG0061600 [Reevesia pubescens]
MNHGTCELQRTVLKDGQVVNVIDSPGLFDFSARSEFIGKEIVKCIDLAKDEIHAVIVVFSVKTRFSQEEEAALHSLQTLFGSKIVNYMIVVFTGGDELEENKETLEDYLGRECPQPLKVCASCSFLRKFLESACYVLVVMAGYFPCRQYHHLLKLLPYDAFPDVKRLFRYFAQTLGFLMFAVGVNSSENDFIEAFKRPDAIVAGYVGQYFVKPLLVYIFGIITVTVFGFPTPLGAGIMLVSCVSGAPLSNCATFLTDPSLAPLSIVMTSLSTATVVFVTPMLSLLLIGKRLPVDVMGMVSSIMQIVIAPIAAGLFLNRLFPHLCEAIRPFLPPLSVLDTACCVRAPLAININSILSPFGITVLLLIVAFHLSAFIAGYFLSGSVFHEAPDVKALQRTLSFEAGMQSSLLALVLANRFFQDPLVSVPPAIFILRKRLRDMRSGELRALRIFDGLRNIFK